MILVVAEKSCKSLGLMDQTTNIAALDDRYNVFIYLVETTIKFEELTGSAYRADRPTINQAEASVFPSFFSQLKKLIIFLFEFSLPGT